MNLMKKLLFILTLFVFAPALLWAQFNHVPNGDFENYTQCPTGTTVISMTGWQQWNGGSCDYFNACATGTMNVPNAGFGYQHAASGDGYIGAASYVTQNAKEMFTRPIVPLVAGNTYEVSLSVSVANNSHCGTNDIGVFFYANTPTFYTPASIPVIGSGNAVPQVAWEDTIITDTQNWVRLTKVFFADSAYDNIAIGGFLPPATLKFTPIHNTTISYAYYYFDSIVVTLYDTLLITYTDTLLCAGDTIEVPYASEQKKQAGNTFTIQLSNSSGSFANPVNIGQLSHDTSGSIKCIIPDTIAAGTGYKMRIIASNYADTSDNWLTFKIGNTSIAKPTATNNGPICDGDTLRFTASTTTSGVSYAWSGPNGFTSSVQNPVINDPNNSGRGAYIVKAYIHGCEAMDTTEVIISKLADGISVALADQPVCAGDTLRLYSNTSTATTYAWSGPNNYSSTIKNPEITNVKVTHTGKFVLALANAHCTLKDTVDVTVKVIPDKPDATNNSPVCANDVIRLVVNSNTTNVSYSWTGPDNFTSTNQNPVISNPIASKAGSYIVTAELDGCIMKDTTIVILHPGGGPSGISVSSNSPICERDTLKLGGSANGNNITYSWTGPNGFTSNLQNPVIPVSPSAAMGTYMLKASDGVCATSATINVVVKPVPADFTAAYNSPICNGDRILFNASSSTTGTTFTWTGLNSFSFNGATPTIAAANNIHNGNYIVTATFNGCSLKDTVIVSVKPAPAIPTVSNNSPICEGDTLKLAGASTTPGVTYSWAGPDNFTSAVQNPVVEKAAPNMQGNYTITATSDGCSSSATTSVQVKSLPMAVALSSNSPICEGGTLEIRSTASNSNATYSWAGPDNFTAFVQNPTGINTATPAATGWYKMQVGLNGCYYRDSILAVVNIIPAVPTVTYNNPICAGETLTLSPGNMNGATYNWNGPNGYTSTLQNASKNNIQTTDGGVYKVKAIVNGCTSADGSVTVTVNPTPFVAILSNPIDSICKGENALFTPIPNNHGGTPTYQWFVNNQLSVIGTSFSTASLNDKDVIRCDMTEYTKCSVPHIDESNYITMSVIPLKTPSVSITANPTTPLKLNEYVTFTAVPVDAGILPKYQWMRNGQNVVGATGSTWSANTLNDNDKITVLVTSDYKCPQPSTVVSNSVTVRVLSGINKMGTAGQLELYPNPNKGSFTLKVTEGNLSNAATIEVLNTLGQIVYTNKIKPTSANWQQGINIDNAADGLYLLRLHTDTGIALLKFTVAR